MENEMNDAGFLVMSPEIMVRIYQLGDRKCAVCLLDDGRAVVFVDENDRTYAHFVGSAASQYRHLAARGAKEVKGTKKQRESILKLLQVMRGLNKGENSETWETLFDSRIVLMASETIRPLK